MKPKWQNHWEGIPGKAKRMKSWPNLDTGVMSKLCTSLARPEAAISWKVRSLFKQHDGSQPIGHHLSSMFLPVWQDLLPSLVIVCSFSIQRPWRSSHSQYFNFYSHLPRDKGVTTTNISTPLLVQMTNVILCPETSPRKRKWLLYGRCSSSKWQSENVINYMVENGVLENVSGYCLPQEIGHFQQCVPR